VERADPYFEWESARPDYRRPAPFRGRGAIRPARAVGVAAVARGNVHRTRRRHPPHRRAKGDASRTPRLWREL